MLAKSRIFLKKYPHAWSVLYFVFYLTCFVWLERRSNLPYHVIHFPLDDYIPFCEYFIIPYFLWFAYVGIIYAWLFFKDRENFSRYITFLYTGMTLFLIVSAVYPNGHLLRPLEFERDNIFIQMVCFLYWADTSTNILPSIHVFNSIAAHMAVMNTPSLNNKRWTVRCSRILCVSIILSTMFLKQHSCVDVILGILFGILMNHIVYHSDFLENVRNFLRKTTSGERSLSPVFARKIQRPAKDM